MEEETKDKTEDRKKGKKQTDKIRKKKTESKRQWVGGYACTFGSYPDNVLVI
jgi:hypothetical protein